MTNDPQTQGYIGTATDPTPDENYTVAGVNAGLPTPETDPEQAEVAGRVLRGTAPPAE